MKILTKMINRIINFFMKSLTYIAVSIASLFIIVVSIFFIIFMLGVLAAVLIPVLGVIFFAACIFYIRLTSEERAWNDGICKKTGKPWILDHYDEDAHPFYTDGYGNKLIKKFTFTKG